MAQIPIVKLNNGTTSYYPFSVGEATVVTHDIYVEHDIGNYKAGDVIPAVTTFDKIISNILNGSEGGSAAIDGITIKRNNEGKLVVGTIQQNQVEGLADTLSDLHQTVTNETDNKLSELKFTEEDSVEMSSQRTTVEAVKMILMKLGMPEENITIRTTSSK